MFLLIFIISIFSYNETSDYYALCKTKNTNATNKEFYFEQMTSSVYNPISEPDYIFSNYLAKIDKKKSQYDLYFYKEEQTSKDSTKKFFMEIASKDIWQMSEADTKHIPESTLHHKLFNKKAISDLGAYLLNKKDYMLAADHATCVIFEVPNKNDEKRIKFTKYSEGEKKYLIVEQLQDNGKTIVLSDNQIISPVPNEFYAFCKDKKDKYFLGSLIRKSDYYYYSFVLENLISITPDGNMSNHEYELFYHPYSGFYSNFLDYNLELRSTYINENPKFLDSDAENSKSVNSTSGDIRYSSKYDENSGVQITSNYKLYNKKIISDLNDFLNHKDDYIFNFSNGKCAIVDLSSNIQINYSKDVDGTITYFNESDESIKIIKDTKGYVNSFKQVRFSKSDRTHIPLKDIF